MEPKDLYQPFWNPHITSGVQELHDRGITGEGIVIGLLDSGIDLNHPALKVNILPSYDYCMDKKFEGGNNDFLGYGTVVASVAVGNSPEMTGVAPGAKVRMYAVTWSCTQDRKSYLEKLLQALIQAVNDGADVISISPGLNTPFSQDAVSVVISRIGKYVPVIMSASNGGHDGLYSGIAGAAADNVIAVGAYETNDLVTWPAVLSDSTGRKRNITYVGCVMGSDFERTFKAHYYDEICLMPPRGVNSTDRLVIAKVHGHCPAPRVVHIANWARYVGLVMLEEDEHLLNATLRLTFNAIQTYRIQPRRDHLTLLSEPYLNLNVTKYRVDNHTIRFQNDDSAANTYKITHQSFEVMYAKTDDGMIVKVPPRQVAENIVPYTFSEVTLKPGEEVSFSVKISPPKNLDLSHAPIFSGAFTITGKNGNRIWPEGKSVLFGPLTFPFEVFKPVRDEQVGLYETYVINNMGYGTTYMSFDLVDVDLDLRAYRFTPDGLKGFHGPSSPIDIDESDYLEGAPMRFRSPHMGVNNFTLDAFSNGKLVPFVSYRLFYRALKIFGNASKFED
ncbi:subtilisin-like protein [Metschnikowia bicuspidata]|uniref:Subtilisin-like protein n=1 Tax=Metschnikowia bicuspidata TaxID=27322 RepID=A0A4V1J2Z7_9ASCO|nr:subtilisin-like protein [Metschnikowia bicuspidata]